MKKMILIVILSLFMIEMGNYGQTLEASEELTLPTHSTPWQDIESNPAYWNLAWKDNPYELVETVRRVNWQYYLTHIYIRDETDCNDMTIDVWNMLHAYGITSIIVLGNLDLTWESFEQCNHTWLLIFAMQDGELTLFPLEPTNGEIYLADDFRRHPELKQYYEGYWYVKPSDLKADLMWYW